MLHVIYSVTISKYMLHLDLDVLVLFASFSQSLTLNAANNPVFTCCENIKGNDEVIHSMHLGQTKQRRA
jgi:hypothetical protein